MERETVLFRRLDANCKSPIYATQGAVGADLFSILTKEIPPGERRVIPTGLAIELPPGFEAQVRSRSGLALKHGISVLNSPGTIDQDFRGPIQVILHNSGQEPFQVKYGDRIAQLVVSPVVKVSFLEAAELSDTDRGEGGFGSTGVA